jgi:hypothetical protein
VIETPVPKYLAIPPEANMLLMVRTKILRTAFHLAIFAIAASFAATAQDFPQTAAVASTKAKADVAAKYVNLPLSFEANQGQASPSVQFLSHGDGYNLTLSPDEAAIAVQAGRDQATLRIRLVGANSHAPVSHEDPQVTRTNYFLVNDPREWRTDIPNYARVRYAGVYDDIDLVYYGNQRRLEHDFIVSPNADPASITFSIQGAKSIRLDPKTGDLVLTEDSGTLRLLKPVSYQQSSAGRIAISSRYRLLADNKISFSIGHYNRALPLIIDPILTYSTYLPGTLTAVASGIAIDPSGNAYIAGTNQAVNGGYYITFVSKINATGTAILYTTYISNSFYEKATGIAVDASGDAYLTGATFSQYFPVVNPIQSTLNDPAGGNAFVTKINPSGSALVFSTYLGGSIGGSVTASGDIGLAIALDSADNVYVAGATKSTDFPTANPFQSANKSAGGNNENQTGFVTKINAAGSALVYSTYLGGTGGYFYGDVINAITVDSSGEAYVTGYTGSIDFPTVAPYQGTNKAGTEGRTAFVTKFNAAGSALVYSTYLGGSFYESANAIALDSAGDAFVGGFTASSDFPTVNPYMASLRSNQQDAFISKFNPNGSALLYSTYLGGYSNSGANGNYAVNSVQGIAVDANGSAFVTGYTQSSGFPVTPNAYLGTDSNVFPQAFLTKFSPDGSVLDYSSYFGGTTGISESNAIAIDDQGHVYLAGLTQATDFPSTPGAPQGANPTPRPGNAFASLFTFPLTVTTTTNLFVNNLSQVAGTNVQFVATVEATSGTVTPTGSVRFFVDGALAATIPLNAAGQATYSTSTLAVGTHTIQSTYLGSTTFEPSTDIITETIVTGGIYVVSGAGQVGYYGALFKNPLVVVVKDASGNPIVGKTVTFSGTGLVFSPSTTTTGSNGQAQAIVKPIQIGNLIATVSASGITTTATFPLVSLKATLRAQPGSVPMIYGHAVPTPTVYSITGFVNGDTQASSVTGAPALSTTATSTSPVGVYPIDITVGTLASTNYTFLFAPGDLQIYKAPLRVQPVPIPVTYGQSIPAPTGFTITGFVNGDTQASSVTGAPAMSTTATSTSPVGVYPITATAGTLASTNYYFTYFTNNLQVYKAPLTYTISSPTITHGQPIPTLTYTLSGFVNGDTTSVVSGSPVLSTTATSSSPVGRYPSTGTVGTLSAHNYYFVEVNGVLTILP